MSSDAPAPVRLQRESGVTEIVLSTPERGNVIDQYWAEAFHTAVSSVGDADRCVLLRSEGRNFCLGGDVTTFGGDDPGRSVHALADRFHDGIRALDAVTVPVVAAVQGWAAGAGFSLALAADLLVIGQSTRFVTAYNALGLTVDGGLSWQLSRRLAPAVAFDLLLTDRALDAGEALDLGLASRSVADDDLTAVARELARGIADRSRHAAVAVKHLARTAHGHDLATHLDAERDSIAAAASGADGREGVAAFVERRAPRFTG